MINLASALIAAFVSIFRTNAALQLEILALRQQIGVLQRAAPKRLKLNLADRLFWACLSRVWDDSRCACSLLCLTERYSSSKKLTSCWMKQERVQALGRR